MKKVFNIVVVLFALMFLNAGLNKLFQYIPMPDDMPEAMVDLNMHLEAVSWLLPLIAISEIIGAILVLIPRTRALGAIVLFPAVIGILLTHLINEPSGIPIAIIFTAIELWIISKNKNKYLPMISE